MENVLQLQNVSLSVGLASYHILSWHVRHLTQLVRCSSMGYASPGLAAAADSR